MMKGMIQIMVNAGAESTALRNAPTKGTSVMTPTLVLPAPEHEAAALAYRQEHYANGEPRINGSSAMHQFDNYADWLAQSQIESAFTNKEGYKLVPATTYFAMLGEKVVGTVQIRHELNEYLSQVGGHIGYSIAPSERGKGYGNAQLTLALEKARMLGLLRVMITCNSDNIASARTILRNGGVHDSDFTEDDGTIVQRYWIEP